MSISHKNESPYFTIIIATLNTELTLEACIQSIIQQTAIDKIEILIKDGGSTDRTIDILEEYSRYICYWESTPDKGIYDAWNVILKRASGDWVLFLGADDTLFNPSIISKTHSLLNDAPDNIDIAYGRVRLVSKNNNKILDLGKSLKKSRYCIKEKMCIPHQSIFHRRTLFSRYGNFSTNYFISSDYEFIRRTLSCNNLLYLNINISHMRIGGLSSNPNNTFLRLREIRQINRQYGSIIPGPLWIATYTNTCIRHSLYILMGQKRARYLLDLFRRTFGLPAFWTKH